MQIIKLDLEDGGRMVEIVVSDLLEANRIRRYFKISSETYNELEALKEAQGEKNVSEI
jgi:hypothetical protein